MNSVARETISIFRNEEKLMHLQLKRKEDCVVRKPILNCWSGLVNKMAKLEALDPVSLISPPVKQFWSRFPLEKFRN